MVINQSRIKAFREKLITWYSANHRAFPWRERSASTYQRIISEVLLQRTKAETVASIFPHFIKDFPSWRKLASANNHQLQKHLKPLGLWHRRVKVVSDLSKVVAKNNGKFPRSLNDVQKLPGVGQYIGNAIMMFYHGGKYPLLDTNMARLLERYFGTRKLADIRYDPYLQNLANRVVDYQYPFEINWAILDFASKICKSKNPLCQECPVRQRCLYRNTRAE